MADLLDRLSGTNLPENPEPSERKLPVHQFFSALLALADGRLTRGQIETAFDIPTTGDQATDLNFLIDTYTGITGGSSALRQERYLQRVHAIFMLAEHRQFSTTFTKTDIRDWLTAAAA